ncbi:riboflavin synthase [Microlunatus sp. Gsoil 973]|uniref:riboflavin synthase n=1 Tax=Microlunatus sp. Gsoil 973 TaxID=2672569 RepID=UPI0012B4EDBD|nr:riboflavin synthase [Microlunatus sp. Gsoil 973]QGN34989.1 riboflavin synthase [Microlunatus sp. Gsoil 973]
MFTGIVEETGEVTELERLGDSARLAIRTSLPIRDSPVGSSVAVSGVCLTVIEHRPYGFVADVMAETLSRTTLGDLVPGDHVNLERAMPAGGRLDGHIVQGHVDGTGTIIDRIPGERWEVLHIGVPVDLARYVAPKGSIAVDGTSLTVVQVTDAAAPADKPSFTVALIPQTLAQTTLGNARVGSPVNLEVDVIAKYVERLTAAHSRREAVA